MHSYYMDILAAGLTTGGTITLHDPDFGYPTPAHEVGMLIDADKDETPIIAVTLQTCQRLGLIRITDDAGPLQIRFDLVYKYTRKISKGTEYKNELADQKKADAPAIEDKGEKPEKKQSNSAKAQAAADEMFERLWRQYPKKKDKARIKPATKRRLYKDYGEEKCQRALDTYKRECEGRDPQYILNGVNFFCSRIFDILDGDAGQDAADTTTPTKEVITEQAAQAEIDQQGLYAYDGGYDMALWAQIKGRYSPEMRAAIEKVMQA
ncbi:MAG: hypothetical protein IJ126_08305 [Lachnospiraceae bacterium]|nr:hypothetical protein [Lachnospiraceae bacterium]